MFNNDKARRQDAGAPSNDREIRPKARASESFVVVRSKPDSPVRSKPE
jgi:hypothetical protein